MKFLIMGCGRIGATVAGSLWEEGHQVTVLDVDPDNFYRLPSDMRDEQGVTLVGDGTVSEDMIRAGIHGADVFVAVDLRSFRRTGTERSDSGAFIRAVSNVGQIDRDSI